MTRVRNKPTQSWMEKAKIEIDNEEEFTIERAYEVGKIRGKKEQKAIDIELIPQIYVHWLMIDGDKPSWNEYATKAMK